MIWHFISKNLILRDRYGEIVIDTCKILFVKILNRALFKMIKQNNPLTAPLFVTVEG